jgi:hypothetical protein
MMEGTKDWAGVKGLRSKWFWLDEKNQCMGAIYTFVNETSAKLYKDGPLAKMYETSKMIVPGSVKMEAFEQLAGTEKLTDMPDAQWPAT